MELATGLAQHKLADWQAMRSKPILSLIDGFEGPFEVIQMPQHPHCDEAVLGEFVTMDEAAAFIDAWPVGKVAAVFLRPD